MGVLPAEVIVDLEFVAAQHAAYSRRGESRMRGLDRHVLKGKATHLSNECCRSYKARVIAK